MNPCATNWPPEIGIGWHHADNWLAVMQGDWIENLRRLPDGSVHCCVTSPPYWGLRNYGVEGQLGLERTPEEYVAKLVAGFHEVRRVLRDDGICWLNLGSSYWGGGGFCSTAPSTAVSKSGKYGSQGALIRGIAHTSGGKRPNRSRFDAPACGSDGKALPNSQTADHACSDSCGESQAGTLTRHHHTVHSGQFSAQAEQHLCKTSRDTLQTDFASSSPAALPLAAQASNTPSSSLNDRDVFSPSAKVSECQKVVPTFSSDVPQSEDNSCLNFSMFSHYVKPKDMVPIPWMVAMALQKDGWFLRCDVLWSKPNPMPESVTDRPTKSHEYIFLLSKRERYFYDNEAIKESGSENPVTKARNNRADKGMVGRDDLYGTPKGQSGNGGYERMPEVTRNKRTVWTVPSQAYPESHFATFPEDLIKPCILAGTSARGCCPKCGAPWERVVHSDNPSKLANVGEDMSGGAAITGNPQTSKGLHRNGGGVYSTSQTLGWQPTCSCGETQTAPCTVLDPFAGSFTTAQVANELGRRCIGIELNPEYIKLGLSRTHVTPGFAGL